MVFILSSKSQSFKAIPFTSFPRLSLCNRLLFPVCSHQCDSVIAITANYWCQKWDWGCLHAWNLSDSTIRPQTPATVQGKKMKYMSAKDINGSHIFTPTCLRLNSSHREGRFYTPPHSHRLSHVSSWRTEEESYLMPCLTWRGHRNRLQSSSLKKV